MKSFIVGEGKKFRFKRRELFLKSFDIGHNTKILDLGSEDGSHISSVLSGTRALPSNVYLADIEETVINIGKKKYGYIPILISDSGKLPFDDHFFDIVFCSSVIEHVTVPKQELYCIKSSKEFKQRAFKRQREFAREIDRVSKGYFVQTPNKWFPLETHTWLPLIDIFPRSFLLRLLSITNKVWIKKADPDWNALDERQIKILFPNSKIIKEKFFGMTKSLIAIKNE